MKRKFSIISVCTALPVALLVGCSSMNQQSGDDPASLTRNEAALEQPAPAAPEPAPTAPVTDYSSAAMKTGLVQLSSKAPGTASLGEQYILETTAASLEDAGDVVVTQLIPEGATYVRSEPPAQRDGNRLTWRFPKMHKGEVQNLRVYLKADREGELAACAMVSALPLNCVSTFVGRPLLALDKTGPDTALLGSEVKYNLLVSNKGTVVARNVVVVDQIPDGLASAEGKPELSFNVGDLNPGQSKTIPVTLKAVKRGKPCNVATATSSNAGKVSDQVCTLIVQPGLAVTKTGDKEQFLTRQAKYTIVVTNTGDTTLTGVVVTDTAPEPTTIAAAEGANVQGNTAVWNIAELKIGEARRFNVALSSKAAGSYCNGVTVTTADGQRESAQACTLWRGVSAILIEVVDNPDPIQVGETTTYTVRVTNQGTADDSNVGVVVNFGPEISPVSAEGATVADKQVTFPKVGKLAPKQVITYTITAKGVQAGDHRLRVSLTSDVLKTPVLEEESTNVY